MVSYSDTGMFVFTHLILDEIRIDTIKSICISSRIKCINRNIPLIEYEAIYKYIKYLFSDVATRFKLYCFEFMLQDAIPGREGVFVDLA